MCRLGRVSNFEYTLFDLVSSKPASTLAFLWHGSHSGVPVLSLGPCALSIIPYPSPILFNIHREVTSAAELLRLAVSGNLKPSCFSAFFQSWVMNESTFSWLQSPQNRITIIPASIDDPSPKLQ